MMPEWVGVKMPGTESRIWWPVQPGDLLAVRHGQDDVRPWLVISASNETGETGLYFASQRVTLLGEGELSEQTLYNNGTPNIWTLARAG